MNINQSHVLLSVRLRRMQETISMSNSDISRANDLSRKSGKPCGITEGDGKFYTFTVISKATNAMSFVKLEDVT